MQKINTINQYLLEKYPTIWNTKLVWMLLGAFAFHIIFFGIGFFSHIDPVSLQTTYVTDDYFRHGLILVHIIISVLMIVGWLIMMFKNNAFKNFYPQSKGKIFAQFVHYFIIIFASTTFYFSYMTGFKMFINTKYPDSEMKGNIETINRANAFLSQNLEYYTLENRLYPEAFYKLYCETDIRKIDRNKKYFVYYNRVYQFYSLYSKKSSKKDKRKQFILPEPEGSTKKEVIYSEESDDRKFATYYFKKEVVDVSPYVKSEGLSYYNFSELFYEFDNEQYYRGINYYDKDSFDKNNLSLKVKKEKVNRKTAELLDKKSLPEVEKLFEDFLKISANYQIRNNLNAKQWAKMVFSPEDYQVRYFIKSYINKKGEEYNPYNSEYAVDSTIAITDANAAIVNESGKIVDDSIMIKDFNPEINKQLSPEKYFKQNITDFYYYSDDLKNLLKSVDEVKSYDYVEGNIHVYLWIAFFLSTFILSFRIAGLKSLLFSIISAGLITLGVTLISVLFAFGSNGGSEFFIAYLVLMVSLCILAVPLFLMKYFSKMITSLFLNMSLNGFVLFVFLIFIIIEIHQKEACNQLSSVVVDTYNYQDCVTIFDTLGLGMSYIILAIGFVFVYFYTSILMQWKARPE